MMKMRKTNQCLKGKIDQADNEEVNNANQQLKTSSDS